jgi:HSP20 family protein
MEKRRHSPVFFFAASPAGAQTHWRPSADVYRVRDGWLLKFDLAGVRMEDVTVEVSGCRVTVSGIRRDWLVDEGASYYSMEIAYNRFERTIDLPCRMENPHVALESKNGLLIIRVTEA